MDPEKHRLDRSPRALNTDAFFADDRASGSAASTTVNQIELKPWGGAKAENLLDYDTLAVKGKRDLAGSSPTSVTFPVFRNRHTVVGLTVDNPLPHRRKTPSTPGHPGAIDTAIAGWNHTANYTCFFNTAANALSGTETKQARLKVKLLFGTGSEYYRHGVCGAVNGASDPTLLIVISGVEPGYSIEFRHPTDPSQKQTLQANNRWGVGITKASIETTISRKYGRIIDYDITVCAAFSTGHAGLTDSVLKSLFPVDKLERVVIFDCLYATLKPALDRIQSLKAGVHIVAYVATGAGNSFIKDEVAFEKLTLGRIPGWHYVNLMGDSAFLSITSARVVSEARDTSARILDPLPATYESALNALVAKLPPRNKVVSSDPVYRKTKGSLPAGAKILADFATDKANKPLIEAFFRQVVTTRRCIGRARLLGWAAPPGEEWHDTILIEFAWEQLA